MYEQQLPIEEWKAKKQAELKETIAAQKSVLQEVVQDGQRLADYLYGRGRLGSHITSGNAALVLQTLPQARAVLTAKDWDKFGRRVNKGAKGIPQLVRVNGYYNVGSIFDVSMTYGNKPYPIPEIKPEQMDKAIKELERLSPVNIIFQNEGVVGYDAEQHAIVFPTAMPQREVLARLPAEIVIATAEQHTPGISQAPYLRKTAMAVSVEFCGRFSLPMPDTAAATLDGMDTHIPPGEERKTLEEIRELSVTMVKPYEDNMLKITNDGRKLALDQRLIDPDLPDDPDSKVNICVGKIFEIWEQTMPQRSAQLVFCDLSTPKAGVFNVYDDMKAKLIERGIPETEIAFIHEANTDARKTELFGKVRSGAVRVLMGSTAKMGAGTNVQQRLVALHHLDVPWRPSDIEQREGRILRQGNENKEVYVFRYVTEGTFDAYSWQLIENKQKFIGQIMTSKSPARSCNDMDEAALSYAEVKALAAGNPLIKEKMDLDVQLTRLKTLKAAHDSQRYELENKIAIGFPAEIRKCKEQIENATVDAATVKEHSVVDADGKDVFCIQLEKKVYYEKEPAGKALLGLLGLALNSEKPVPIGYFNGMELQIQHLPFGNEYHARLVGSGTYSTQLGADVLGNLTRLSNLANGIEPSIEKTRNMQIQLEQQLASAEEEVKRPFPQATELTEKSKRLAVLEGLLNMNDKDIVTDTEPEQQCQTDNRQRGQEER